MEVPCRVCMECRLNYTKEWAVRVCNEASCYDDNSFITLTYDEEHLPKDNSLHKEDFQKFMKRLRKYLGDKPIRYFACGEYGSLGRPHYHANIFNWYPKDSYLFKYEKGKPLFRSPTLEKLWPFGYSMIGEVNFNTARYVASYIVKQHRGKEKSYYERNNIQPEFVLMSQGIGKQFLKENAEQLRGLGYIPSQGFKVKFPRYYENKLFTEDERKKRNVEKLSYLEKARKIFEESLNFDDYRTFNSTHKERTGRDIKRRDWIEYKRLEAQKEREKRLKEKVERSQNERKGL